MSAALRGVASELSLGRMRTRALAVPILDADAERKCLVRALAGDVGAVHELLRAHARLVVSIASRYLRHGLAASDLVAEGNLGLLEALRRFDLNRPSRFSTYAAWWVRSRIQQFALDNRRIVAYPATRGARHLLGRLARAEHELMRRGDGAGAPSDVASAAGASVTDVELVYSALRAMDVSLADEHEAGVEVLAEQGSPEDLVGDFEEAHERTERMRVALSRLRPRERWVIERRFLEPEAWTFDAIGRELGLSRERVRQIERDALAELRSMVTDGSLGAR